MRKRMGMGASEGEGESERERASERERERNQEPRDDNRYYPPDYRYDRRYCVREQITEWYRGERYVYWETRCN